MSATLQRTAYSPIIYDMVDFSNALFNKEGQLIGQAENCPAHLGSMHFSAQACFEKFGQEDLKAGDIVAVNDPYGGGTHTPDITFTMPVYAEGKLIGFVVSRAHWTDLGGAAGGASVASQHVVEDGLVIPPTKIFEAGVPRKDIIDIIKNNSRLPQYIEGDLYAHVGALKTGEEGLQELVRKYGLEVVELAMEETLNYSERRTRRAIREIPDGEYQGEYYIDCDGVTEDSIVIRVTLTVKDDEITVDFAGTGKINRGSVNSPQSNTYTAVYYGLKFFLDPECPSNAGFYRPIHIKLPEGTWVNAKPPASTRVCTTVGGEAIANVIWIALSKAMPDKVNAPCAIAGATYIGGRNPETDSYYMLADLPSGGWGATPFGDGLNVAYARAGNCMDLPPEVAELENPVYCERREFIMDSGGPGKYRGGVGERQTWRVNTESLVAQICDNFKHPALGVQGGKPGMVGRSIVNYGEEDERVTAGYDGKKWKKSMIANFQLKAGETHTFEAPGGGGWGDPLDREPEFVREDVIDNFVSLRSAKEDYGVILDPRTYEIDHESTRKLRERKGNRRGR
jgi:N-methylhydantoinase B/oxoprolinase/acetone carboxylase alpha subunit